MKDLTNIIQQINNFPYFYEMGSNRIQYAKAKQQAELINSILPRLSSSELREVKNGLTVSIEHLTRYFPIFEETPVDHIIDFLNGFDYDYELFKSGCDTYRYAPRKRELEEFNNLLSHLSDSQLRSIKEGLTVSIAEVIKCFPLLDLSEPEPESESEPKKSYLSQIMKTAWYYMRKGIFATFSECLKASWKAYRILSRLKAGILELTFRKATGQLRNAKGTLNSDQFSFNGKGVRKEHGPDVIKYFDLDKDAWRCFRIERLVSIAA